MNKKEIEVVLQRIENWYARLPEMIVYYKQRNFNAKYGWSKDPTPFENRRDLNYKKIKTGDELGKKWESAWFYLYGEIPKDWLGKQVAADLIFLEKV